MPKSRREAWDAIGDWWWWRRSDEEIIALGQDRIGAHILPFLRQQGLDPKGKRMLDIGCGQGIISGNSGDYFSEVHAVDISPIMVGHAKKRWAQKSNVFFSVNNGEDLKEFESDYFDFCFSYVVLQHIPSLATVSSYIREIGRVLKPGGLFRIQVQTGSDTRFKFVPKFLYVAGVNFLVEHDLIYFYSRLTMKDRRSVNAFPGVVTTQDFLLKTGASALLEGEVTREKNEAQSDGEILKLIDWFSGRKIDS